MLASEGAGEPDLAGARRQWGAARSRRPTRCGPCSNTSPTAESTLAVLRSSPMRMPTSRRRVVARSSTRPVPTRSARVAAEQTWLARRTRAIGPDVVHHAGGVMPSAAPGPDGAHHPRPPAAGRCPRTSRWPSAPTCVRCSGDPPGCRCRGGALALHGVAGVVAPGRATRSAHRRPVVRGQPRSRRRGEPGHARFGSVVRVSGDHLPAQEPPHASGGLRPLPSGCTVSPTGARGWCRAVRSPGTGTNGPPRPPGRGRAAGSRFATPRWNRSTARPRRFSCHLDTRVSGSRRWRR